ncbi:MAG: ATP-binding cassette domain-containing protein [Roseitalea sp.]|jgi:peptide/nickel transport system ATP-binding protein|nr:ATP-binding cassette domain-containing protein [Roseitalea sp.]MBO6721212.1 ATP-binding cassette domain-containing protein [Roseitalea sp.]MBO6744270.1 ATP-binding cassette domain-containing protein [Roseitalea sp.]
MVTDPPTTAHPVLELRAVSKVYRVQTTMFNRPRDLRAVDDVSLQLHRGDVLGLVGESGCGKSTLSRLLLGLEAPTSGEVLIDGKPMTGTSIRDRARRIQPIFQDPYASLNPRKTVADIIALPLRVHSIGERSDDAKRVTEMMDRVGLPARMLLNYPNQLSGGQRQRVAIARALVMRPEIIICDEPTSALDVSVQSQILNLLMDLHDEFGLTYLFISHDLSVVQHIASRVAVMYLGRIIEARKSTQLFADPLHPYSKALLDSVLTPEIGMGLPETNLGATFPNPIDPPPGCAFHPRCGHAMQRCHKERPPTLREGSDRVECWLHDDLEAEQTRAVDAQRSTAATPDTV